MAIMNDARPDDAVVAEYKELAKDELHEARVQLRHLQEQNYQAKKRGRPRLSKEISAQKERVKALEKRELKLRKQANNQVLARGGIVDSGHDYASKNNLNKPPPISRQTDPRLRKTSKHPDKDKPVTKSHYPISTNVRLSKTFAHQRANEAAVKRLGLNLVKADILKTERAGGNRGGRTRAERKGAGRVIGVRGRGDGEDEDVEMAMGRDWAPVVIGHDV